MPKRKRRKSKLQKKKEDPNSTYYKRKADKLWSKLVRAGYDGKCAICGATKHIQAHHLIPREMYSHRYSISNGIALCASHHKYSFELSAHRASVQFLKWLIEADPKRWKWLQAQKPGKQKLDTFQESWDFLKPKMVHYIF